jgi:hypothetical protein
VLPSAPTTSPHEQFRLALSLELSCHRLAARTGAGSASLLPARRRCCGQGSGKCWPCARASERGAYGTLPHIWAHRHVGLCLGHRSVALRLVRCVVALLHTPAMLSCVAYILEVQVASAALLCLDGWWPDVPSHSIRSLHPGLAVLHSRSAQLRLQLEGACRAAVFPGVDSCGTSSRWPLQRCLSPLAMHVLEAASLAGSVKGVAVLLGPPGLCCTVPRPTWTLKAVSVSSQS